MPRNLPSSNDSRSYVAQLGPTKKRRHIRPLQSSTPLRDPRVQLPKVTGVDGGSTSQSPVTVATPQQRTQITVAAKLRDILPCVMIMLSLRAVQRLNASQRAAQRLLVSLRG